METAMMIISTLNLIVTTAMLVLIVMLPQQGEKEKQPRNPTPPKALSDEEAAELQRVKREAEQRELYMQNFLNYTGESQIKGGD